MATYVNNLRLKEIATGDESGTWGTSTNTNLELIADSLGYGTQDGFATDANSTTTVADGTTDPARAFYFKVTSSATLTATRELTIAPNTISRVMIIENATTGSQSIEISQGSGSNVTIPTGIAKLVYLDGAGAGAEVVDIGVALNLALGGGTATGSNTGDQTITLTSDVTGSGTGSFATTIADNAVSLAKMADMATASLLGRDTAGTGDPEVLSAATARSLLGLATTSDVEFGSMHATSFVDEVYDAGNTGTAINLDLSNGGVQTMTLTGNATITLTGESATANTGSSVTLILTNDATADRTITLAGGTFYVPNGAANRSTAANAIDVWTFFTPDQGTTWYYNIPLKNVS
jgi:hypothetical protein